MARHNKKRNVGLIYEQLIMRMSRALVENDSKRVKTIKGIITKHFAKNTELYKEFRLFNALIRTSGVSESLATRILGETQKAAKNHNSEALNTEKSSLIRDINYKLNESDFYDQRVVDYTNYATIQTLLNGWRSEQQDVRTMISHEKKIHEWLQRDETETVLEEQKSPNINDLTVSIMQEKFSKKYNGALTERQKCLLDSYLTENFGKLSSELESVERDLSRVLRKYKKVGSNKILLEKTERIQSHIETVKLQPDQQGAIRGMVLCQLLNELNGEINGR